MQQACRDAVERDKSQESSRTGSKDRPPLPSRRQSDVPIEALSARLSQIAIPIDGQPIPPPFIVNKAPGPRSRPSLRSAPRFEAEVLRSLKQLNIDVRNNHAALHNRLDCMFGRHGKPVTYTRSDSLTDSDSELPERQGTADSLFIAEETASKSQSPRLDPTQRKESKSHTSWSGKCSFHSYNSESGTKSNYSEMLDAQTKAVKTSQDSNGGRVSPGRRPSVGSKISNDSNGQSNTSKMVSNASGAVGRPLHQDPHGLQEPSVAPSDNYSESPPSPGPKERRGSFDRVIPMERRGSDQSFGNPDAAKQATVFHNTISAIGQRNALAVKAWNFLDNPESSLAATVFDAVYPYFVAASVVFALLQTMEPPPVGQHVCRVVDLIADSAFFIEILARYIVSPKHGMRFFMNPLNAIDVVASLPMVLHAALLVDPEINLDRDPVLLCMVAIARLMKIMRRFQKIHLLLGAFQLAAEALPVLMFVLAVITLCFSSAIYLVEPRENIDTMPLAIYFTLVTVTSLGYGDIVPTSDIGTCIVTVLAVSSVLYMAVPFGIVGHAFTRVWEDRDRILLIRKTQAAMYQWGYTPQDMPVLFQIFDSQGDGELNLCDFKKMITAMRIGLNDQRIGALFHDFDRDGDGFVSDKEMVRNVFPLAFHDVYTSDSVRGDDEDENPEAETIGVDTKLCRCGHAFPQNGQFCSMCGQSFPADNHHVRFSIISDSGGHSVQESNDSTWTSELPEVPELSHESPSVAGSTAPTTENGVPSPDVPSIVIHPKEDSVLE